MLVVLGVVLFVLGLLFSIAWHELGHLFFAKLFKVRVTQYMIGFGRTVFSRQRGETEYGIKLVPAGGYIRMIGMVPPGRDGRRALTSTAMGPIGMFRQLVEDTRKGDRSQVLPTDDGRQFYQLHPAKRIVIMLAGPVQNLILAMAAFLVLVVGLGIKGSTTTIGTVSACVLPAAAAARDCTPADARTPAAAAGLRPGDVVESFDGHAITSWDQLTPLIRGAAGRTVPVTYRRAGVDTTVSVPVVSNTLAVYDDQGDVTGTTQGGFLGVSSLQDYQRQSPGQALVLTGRFIGTAAHAVAGIPARIPALWGAIFSGAKRDASSPVGIYGVGRISGQVFGSDTIATKDKIELFLQLLAGLNMSLFLLNLLPLLPLDGGHVLGAVIEWVRRGWARVRRRAMPGPFDVAKLMPVAYVVALLIIGLSLLTLTADIVNPVQLG